MCRRESNFCALKRSWSFMNRVGNFADDQSPMPIKAREKEDLQDIVLHPWTLQSHFTLIQSNIDHVLLAAHNIGHVLLAALNTLILAMFYWLFLIL